MEVIVITKVVLRRGEPQQQLLRRFRKAVTRSGVMGTVRQRRWFVSTNERRRLEKKKVIGWQKRRQMKREEEWKKVKKKILRG
jgi:ribosomal protein S21